MFDEERTRKILEILDSKRNSLLCTNKENAVKTKAVADAMGSDIKIG